MKRAFVAAGAALGLLVAAAVALPFLFPLESWKPQILARVKEATGRELRLDGPMRLTFLPRIELSLFDVGFSNPPGKGGGEMVTLKELELVLQVWPLLSGEVMVDRVELESPVVSLEVDAAGRPNWLFDTSSAPATAPVPSGGDGLVHLDFSDVRLEHGTIRYTDRRTGLTTQVDEVGVKLSLPSRDGPLKAAGELRWKDGRVAVDLEAARPRELLGGGDSRVRASVDADGGSLDYDGTLGLGSKPHASGALALDVPSVRALAAWTGAAVGLPPGVGDALQVRGKADVSRDAVDFQDASLAFDGMQASGRVSVALAGKKPRVDATLDVKALDLTRWLPAAEAAKPGDAAAPAGWSETPFPATGLGAVDAALALTVGSLATPRLRAGQGALAASLQDGRLSLDLTALALHEGNAHGAFVLDAATAGSVGIDADLHLAAVQAEPLLKDASGGEWLAGKATVDLSLRGRGRNMRELLGSFDGKGSLELRDGAIRGINLAAMVLNVAAAFQKKSEGDRTEFSEIRGTFLVTDGVLKNDDLKFASPLLNAEGNGNVDFGRRQVDYHVSPTFVAPVVGQMTGGIVSMRVPVLIRGPWHSIVYAPDLVGLIREGVTAPVNILKGAKDFTQGLFRR